MGDDDLIRRGDAVLAVTAADKECLGANDAREFIRALPAASAEDVRAGALKEAAARLELAAGVYADRAKDTISTNPLSAHPTDTPTEGQLLAYDYDNMQAMLDGAAAAALRAERDTILALIPEAKP